MPRLFRGVPTDPTRFFLDQVGERHAMRGSIREAEPEPRRLCARWQLLVCAHQVRRMPEFVRLRGENVFGNSQSFARADDEKPPPRLRQKPNGVDDQGAEAILRAGDGGADGSEVLSAVRREGATDVLKNHDRWRAVLRHEVFDESPEGPEGS